jgi:uncharacterized protein (DUF1015 family)
MYTQPQGTIMPDIRPFRAWRFDTARAGDLASVISPPYDVISPELQEVLYSSSPFNVIRLELTSADAGDPLGHDGEVLRHKRAKSTLQSWVDDGILRKDNEPALYLYRQGFEHEGRQYERNSILAAVRLSPWSSGSILPHERTLAAPRAERLGLLRAVNANVSPIWALYEDHGHHIAHAIRSATEIEPLPEQSAIDDNKVVHTITAITARQPVDTIRRALAEHPLFIADGHHRYETALAYRDEALIESGPRDVGPRDFVLMVLTAVDDPGLVVLPTHRLIHGVSAERVSQLSTALDQYFQVNTFEVPTEPADLLTFVERLLPQSGASDIEHRFLLLASDPARTFLLEPRDVALAGISPAPELAELDVWLAHSLLLEKCFGIASGHLERQTNVTYTRDTLDAAKAVANGAEQFAVLLAPTPISQLLDVARAGAVMPQKSTYFYPKPATGLVLRLFEG